MSSTDTIRKKRGFLIVKDVATKLGITNDILEPHSLLASSGVVIGTGNTFYPNVVIECTGDGIISIGNNNVFYPGTYILSSSGSIRIGDGNEFGSGGCTIKANMLTAAISIGDNGRYCDNTSIMGQTTLGSGSQIIGAITVQSCTLAAGDDYRSADVDGRGSVLKGFGLARGLALQKGEVINGSGDFSKAVVELQSSYHPRDKKVSSTHRKTKV